jgi:hypothetical protein
LIGTPPAKPANIPFNAANAAIKGKAVPTGQWIERAEIGGPGEFDHLIDERYARLRGEAQLVISKGSITVNGAPRNLKDRNH